MIHFGDISTIRVPIDNTFNRFPCVQPFASDRLIITESNYLSVLYDLNNLLPIKSWKFTHLEHLTAPVIYDYVNQKFVALKSKKVTFLFENESSLQFKIKSTPICAISPSVGESVVLFQNGVIRKLSSVILEKDQLYSDLFIRPNETIVKIKVKELDQSILMIALLCQSSENEKRICFIKYNMVSEEKIEDGQFLVSSDCTSLILMSNGDILTVINKSVVNLLTKDGQQHLKSFGSDQIVASVGLSDNDIVLVLQKEDSVYFLCNFNVNYKFKMCEVTLDLMPLEDCLIEHHNCLYVGCTKGVMIIPFHKKRLSLADVLGKGNSKESINRHLTSGVETLVLESLKQKKDSASLSRLVNKFRNQLTERSLFEIFYSLISSDKFSLDNKVCLKVLNTLFSLSFNHSTMVAVMKDKNLSIESVFKMLQVLIQLLEVDRDVTIDWIIAILDAYFTSLILTKTEEVKQLFSRLLQKVDDLSKVVSHCQDLRLTIESMINNHSLNPSSHSSLYSKEEFMVGIIDL